MEAGGRTGCHQMPERSFFIKGMQFPVCARCTGVIIGQTVAAVVVACGKKPCKSAFCGCVVMLIDWLVQRLGIKESTNPRRLVTGLLGGFGLGIFYFSAFRKLLSLVFGTKR